MTRLRRSGLSLLLHTRYTDGVLDALTGQDPTFSRAAEADYTSSTGVTATAPHSQPRFEVLDGVPAVLIEDGGGGGGAATTLSSEDGRRAALSFGGAHVVPLPEEDGTIDSADRGHLLGLFHVGGGGGSGQADQLYYEWLVTPGAFAAYVAFVAPASGSPVLLRIGGTMGARYVVDVAGGQIRVTHHNGASSVTSTTVGASFAHDDLVEVRAILASNGSVQVAVSVEGAAEVVATASGSLSLASAWEAERLYIGGAGGETARVEVREVKVHSDPSATMQALREA